jgi:cold shock CspA family protein
MATNPISTDIAGELPPTSFRTAQFNDPTRNRPVLGEVRWFGGLNRKTGRENDYGFISGPGGDVFFHRSQTFSPAESLTEGAKVVFRQVEDRAGKLIGESVRVLLQMPERELVHLMKLREALSPEDLLTVVHFRTALSLCENEVLRAVSVLAALEPMPGPLKRFWEKFPPASVKDPFFLLAPASVKANVYKRLYSEFRDRLVKLFTSIEEVKTSLNAQEIYLGLDSSDEAIAKHWAGDNNYEGVLAKMLSARAAEKAVKKFYEKAGLRVEDISISQLEGKTGDWTTHDLWVGATVAVDVKNARRPINGRAFYVEHTVPRFKLDRRNRHVQIAGILSPYLKLQYIQKPHTAAFNIEELIFLGETSRDSIDQLASTFGSATFEVTRNYENTVPNWVFGYPQVCYRAFSTERKQFTDDCEWPAEGEWKYVLDDSEMMQAIPALCLAGKPLPAEISARLSVWQVDFYFRMQRLVGDPPALPIVFLGVLTDFLRRLNEKKEDFSPNGYRRMLFAGDPEYTVSYPLGAIDPLGLVDELINTLTTLWGGRAEANLDRFFNFRFGGLGILQGREKEQRNWVTIVAYCGGIVYQADQSGAVLINADGRPQSEKGKCGNTPLIVGKNRTCPSCGKLVCDKCEFCSKACQEQKFRELVELNKRKSAQRQPPETPSYDGLEAAENRWKEVPFDAYKDDFWRR